MPMRMPMPLLLKTTLATALLTLAGHAVWAQTVYRIVGPDGKVSFSDQPPAPAAAAKSSTSSGTRGALATGSGPALPYELAQVARQFPVTLYTAPDCNPCAAARNLLSSRGVPFTERTIVSNEDIEALKRISGESSLPFGTIGRQQLKGYSDVEWTQYLDAAAYPKTSQLPQNYRAPAATPLVAAKAAEAPGAAQPAATAPQPTASPADDAPRNLPSSSNPKGIQF